MRGCTSLVSHDNRSVSNIRLNDNETRLVFENSNSLHDFNGTQIIKLGVSAIEPQISDSSAMFAAKVNLDQQPDAIGQRTSNPGRHHL